MDNVPEREQSDEPRMGIAPFDNGTEIEDGGRVIKNKPILLRPFGKVDIRLYKPLPGDLELETIEEEEKIGTGQQAFTVDLSGKITRGKLIDFIEQGYYMVSIELPSFVSPDGQVPVECLTANIWIDNTETITSSTFESFSKTTDKAWFYEPIKHDEKGYIYNNFMLPNDPKILEALRISISTKE